MKTMSVSDTRNHLAELINQVAYQSERVLIVKMGKPVALLVPINETNQSAVSAQPPSKTAGTIQLPPSVDIEKVFEAMKEPYDIPSLLGL